MLLIPSQPNHMLLLIVIVIKLRFESVWNSKINLVWITLKKYKNYLEND